MITHRRHITIRGIEAGGIYTLGFQSLYPGYVSIQEPQFATYEVPGEQQPALRPLLVFKSKGFPLMASFTLQNRFEKAPPCFRKRVQPPVKSTP
jgi:hypothetical protein